MSNTKNSSQNKAGPPVCNYEEQMILRVPQHIAEELRKMIHESQATQARSFDKRIAFAFEETPTGAAEFALGDKKYQATLVNLPCVVDSLKTLDNVNYFKSADVGQMLVVHDTEKGGGKAKRPHTDKNGTVNSGITPPFKGIKKRFRRTYPNIEEVEAVELELMRIRGGAPMDNIDFEVVEDEDLTDEDNNPFREAARRREERLRAAASLASTSTSLTPSTMMTTSTTPTTLSDEPPYKKPRKDITSELSKPTTDDASEFEMDFATELENTLESSEITIPPPTTSTTTTTTSSTTSTLAEQSVTYSPFEDNLNTKSSLTSSSSVASSTVMSPISSPSSPSSSIPKAHVSSPPVISPTLSPPKVGIPISPQVVTSPPLPPQVVVQQNQPSPVLSTSSTITTTTAASTSSTPQSSYLTNPVYIELSSQETTLNNEIKTLRKNLETRKQQAQGASNPIVKARFDKQISLLSQQLTSKEKNLLEIQEKINAIKI